MGLLGALRRSRWHLPLTASALTLLLGVGSERNCVLLLRLYHVECVSCIERGWDLPCWEVGS